MDPTQLAAYVVLVVDDAERRFGADLDSALHDFYAREAALDLWLTRPGITGAIAHQVLCLVRTALRRRANDHARQDNERRRAIDDLRAELAKPVGHCPSRRLVSEVEGATHPDPGSTDRESNHTERGGAMAAR